MDIGDSGCGKERTAVANAAVNNGGWEVQGAALLRLRQRMECAGLRLWSEGAMVQAGMTAAVTKARSWCARGRCRWQWRLG